MRGFGDGFLFPFYKLHRVGDTESSCQLMHDVRLPYKKFRYLLCSALYSMGCSNAAFIGTHRMRHGGIQLRLVLGVSKDSVRQRGYWLSYTRMKTSLSTNNRRGLGGDLLAAPTALINAIFSKVAFDAISATSRANSKAGEAGVLRLPIRRDSNQSFTATRGVAAAFRGRLLLWRVNSWKAP